MSDVLVVKRGEELLDVLSQYVATRDLKSAWLTGLGGSGSVTLGFYDIQTKSYAWKTFDGPMEINSLTGNLSIVEGKPFWHVHGVFSGPDFQVVGGHIKEMIVGLTVELHIYELEQSLERQFDDETGLNIITNV